MTKNKKNLKVDEESLEEESNAGSGNKAFTAEEISKKYTVAELKKILRENGLKVSGKKQELVERVLPVFNGDSDETSDEEESSDSELTEKTNVVRLRFFHDFFSHFLIHHL